MNLTEKELQINVKNALQAGRLSRIPWVPLIAHIASVVTLIVAFFGRQGHLSFDIRSKLDWIIAVAMTVALIIGVRYVLRDARVGPRELTRKELMVFINHTRYSADRQVISVAGDLTWLPEDEQYLEDLVKRRNLDVRIYYQQKGISPEVSASVKKLTQAGIDFRPYPEGIDAPFRCTLIDGDSPEEVRLCVYRRIGKKATGILRSEQRFEWVEHEGSNDRLIRAVKAFLWAAERRTVATITVGISGVNNVGKTSLALALQERLKTHYQVNHYPDVFRDATSKSGLEPSYLMLITQLWREASPSGDVAIYDRTTVDNFCYLHVKNSHQVSPHRSEANGVLVAAAKKFDIILLVSRKNEDWSTKTTYVNPKQRKHASDWLESFYREHGITTERVVLDGTDLQTAARNAADDIANKIETLAEQRRIRRSLTGRA